METMVELERARQLIVQQARFVGEETIPLNKAYGRVLAETVISPLSLPPFDRSPLDGYAYISTENDKAPLRLKVVDEIPAGTWSQHIIKPGEAARIFTGAPLPEGANCVVRMEDTVEENGEVVVNRPVLPFENIIGQGEEVERGDLILARGAYLNPPAVGYLSSVGINRVKVFRRPRVGILSTGSELLEAGTPLAPGKIYNSNSYTLCGLVQGLGCDAEVHPIVSDQIEDTMTALKSFADMDVIITTGGASVGDYDLMPRVLEELGCQILFWKVNLKPGTPVLMGYKNEQLFFSLSGNPAAAMATFELLVGPVLRKVAGRSDWQGEIFDVRMEGNFAKWGKQRRFLRAKAILKNGEIWADINQAQTSGILGSFIHSQLLVDVPAAHGPVRHGSILKAMWINAWNS